MSALFAKSKLAWCIQCSNAALADSSRGGQAEADVSPVLHELAGKLHRVPLNAPTGNKQFYLRAVSVQS